MPTALTASSKTQKEAVAGGSPYSRLSDHFFCKLALLALPPGHSREQGELAQTLADQAANMVAALLLESVSYIERRAGTPEAEFCACVEYFLGHPPEASSIVDQHHVLDLRYVLQVLRNCKSAGMQDLNERYTVDAAITGLEYVIARSAADGQLAAASGQPSVGAVTAPMGRDVDALRALVDTDSPASMALDRILACLPPVVQAPARMSLDEWFAEAERIGLTADVLAAQLRERPEFADCLPAAERPAAATPTAIRDVEPARLPQDVRAALTFALWHHQGGSSSVGQPIRTMLAMDAHERLSEAQVALAKRVSASLDSIDESKDAHAGPVPYGRLLGLVRAARDYVNDERLRFNEAEGRKREETKQEHSARIARYVRRNRDTQRLLEDIDEAIRAIDAPRTVLSGTVQP